MFVLCLKTGYKIKLIPLFGDRTYPLAQGTYKATYESAIAKVS